jgi:thiol-disulfide isomerase/thioredoxin
VKFFESKPVLVVGGLLIAVAGGTVGYLAYQTRAPHPVLAPLAATSPDPVATAQKAKEQKATATAKEKTIPDLLPEVALADRTGKMTQLSSFANRPLMVNFWATWCAPCRREIPLLNRLHAERKAQNVQIVGIAVDFRDDVLKFVEKTPLSYPLLIGEEDGLAAVDAFGMGMGFPFSVFVDSQNRILTVRVGELHEDEANFAFDRLLDIDSGKLTREAAQAQVADAFREMAAARAQAEARQH